MLFVQNISLTQFRNYLHQKFNFSERIVAISGDNGTGKTNLLDAIYYLCFTKSYFSKSDAQSAHNNLQGFRIEGTITGNDDPSKLVCIFRENNRKEFQLNGNPYKKFSEHIGKFPCVFVAPDDVQVITEGSEKRRNFFDAILSQLYPTYLQNLIDYKKILDERNSLLKAIAERNYFDETLLDILDEQLVKNGEQVYKTRNQFLEIFIPQAQVEYNLIAENNDIVTLEYLSQLHNSSFKELLQENRQRDFFLQRTGCGIHKDDLEIKLNEMPFKNMASQGQRKSLLFALKLAEFTILKEKKGYTPLLLLDDIFEKLDAQRMHNLLRKVCLQEEAQVFITDTHKERLQKAFEDLRMPYQLIELNIEQSQL